MNFLSMIPLRAYLYIALAAFVAFILWREHRAVVHAKQERLEKIEALQALKNEKLNRQIERDDRRLADEVVKPVEVKVARIAARPDPVGVFCRPSPVRTSPESGSPASTPSAPVDRGNEAPLRDIGGALGAARREAETNNTRYEGLIQFERERTH